MYKDTDYDVFTVESVKGNRVELRHGNGSLWTGVSGPGDTFTVGQELHIFQDDGELDFAFEGLFDVVKLPEIPHEFDENYPPPV